MHRDTQKNPCNVTTAKTIQVKKLLIQKIGQAARITSLKKTNAAVSVDLPCNRLHLAKIMMAANVELTGSALLRSPA